MKIKETEHGTLIEDIQSTICDMMTYDELADKYLELLDDNKRLREALEEIVDMPILYEDVVTDSLRNIAKQALGGAE
jgi:hypothetical protein